MYVAQSHVRQFSLYTTTFYLFILLWLTP